MSRQSQIVREAQSTLNCQTDLQEQYENTYQVLRATPFEKSQAFQKESFGTISSQQVFNIRSQILVYRQILYGILPKVQNLDFMTDTNSWKNRRNSHINKIDSYINRAIAKESQFDHFLKGDIKMLEQEDNREERKEEATKRQFQIIQKRKQYLQGLLQNRTTSFKGSKACMPLLSEDAAKNIELELKFLSVYPMYNKMKEAVFSNLEQHTPILTRFLLDRTELRVDKPQRRSHKPEENNALNLNTNALLDDKFRKKQRIKQFYLDLKIHGEAFFDYHRKRLKQLRKVAVQAKNQCQGGEAQQKIWNAKMKALQEHNMGQYLKIISETKDTKIQHIIQQTNKFISQLGSKVLAQKGQPGQPTEFGDSRQEDGQESTLEHRFNEANRIYQALTHSVKEKVLSQPTIMNGGTLKPFQISGLQWLVSLYNNNLNGILADEMGLGKTVQTIALISHLIEFKKIYGPFLIVASSSVLPNWEKQFKHWSPSIKIILYHGNPTDRARISKTMSSTSSRWSVCLTTNDFIMRDRNVLRKHHWQYVVVDEGHRMKNKESGFAKVMMRQYDFKHRLLLTGTPLQNNLNQLWALLNFLLPKVFNCSDDFQKWFSIPISSTRRETIKLNQEEQHLIVERLHQVLRPFLLRRVKREVETELPKKVEKVLKVELSSWQKLMYRSMVDEQTSDIETGETKQLGNLMIQLRKICNHPFLILTNSEELPEDTLIRSSGKLQLLDRILPKLLSFGHRMLIFSQFTTTLDILERYLNVRKIKYLRLDGSTKYEDRCTYTEAFNKEDSQYPIFILTTRAGGLGINLQTADTVIMFDADWNPQMDLQAQDRAHRIGQTRDVLVLKLVTNTVAQTRIQQEAAFKKGLDSLYIQGGLFNQTSSEDQRRQTIEEMLKKEDIFKYQGPEDIPDDDQINRLICRDNIEYEEFRNIDRQIKKIDMIEAEKNGVKGTHKMSKLMGDDEVPEWLKEILRTEKEHLPTPAGRGMRITKKINYQELFECENEDDLESQTKGTMQNPVIEEESKDDDD